MTKFWITMAAATLAAAPVLADGHAATGDAAAGEEAFGKQCVACHVVVNDAGETLAGRNAKTGPNLYAVAGRPAGSIEDFRYGTGMEEAGEKGLVWTEESFVAYVQDPTAYLREYTENKRARGKMSFKVRAEEDALNLYAYLFSLGEPATN
ncbi:MAG: cytochrome C [Pseudomonadota bacterium]